MGFNIDHNNKVVPWYDSNEFFEIYYWLSDSEISSKYMALNRLRVWEERNHGITKQCPISVISTIHILYVMLQDDIWDWSLISNGFKSECLNSNCGILDFFSYFNRTKKPDEYLGERLCSYISKQDNTLSLRKQYCMAVIRVVNLFVDQFQSKIYARSISVIANEIGIPQLLVEIRHQSTHGSELPSIDVCRVGGILALFFLFFKYWRKQFELLSSSITEVNNQIIIYFEKLILLISRLSFSWSAHKNIKKEISKETEDYDLLTEVRRFSQVYHNSISKFSLEFISKNISTRKKVINYYKDLKITGNSTEKKIADKMLKSLTDFRKFENKTGIKPNKLKKWTKNLYNNLPEFYDLVGKIVNIARTMGTDEKIIGYFIIREILTNICPLCCPIAVVAMFKLIHYLSNNIKVEILSFLIFNILKRNKTTEVNMEQSKFTTFKVCKQDKEKILFYWLRTFIPNIEKVESNYNESKIMKYYADYKEKQLFEVIMLLTFYKKIDSTKNKKLLDFKKTLTTIFESQITFFSLFSKMLDSITSLIFKNGVVSNDIYTTSFIRLLKELKCYELTSNLLYALQSNEKSLYSSNLKLYTDFISIGNRNIYDKNNRGILIETAGLTTLLKTGTYWDRDEFKLCYCFETNDSVKQEVVSTTNNRGASKLDEEEFENDLETGVFNVCSCLEEECETKVINMCASNDRITSNYMNNCLLNAEKFNRQNIGKKEIMLERVLNIDWKSVVNLSEV